MSDAAAGAALVVEQVLLYDASLLTIGRKRVAAAEFLINEIGRASCRERV